MKKLLKFYGLLFATIISILMYSYAVFPLLTISSTIANILGWLLFPAPVIFLRWIILMIYPALREYIKEIFE